MSHDKVIRCRSRRFDCLLQVFSGDRVDWFRYSIMYHSGLLRLMHFDPAIVSVYHGFLGRSLICCASLALMVSNCRYPHLHVLTLDKLARYNSFIILLFCEWTFGRSYDANWPLIFFARMHRVWWLQCISFSFQTFNFVLIVTVYYI